MRKEIKPAKVEYTCDITGKDLSKEDNSDPTRMEFCLLTRLKKKAANEMYPKSAYPAMDEDLRLEYEPVYFNIDICAEEAYNIYKLLNRKYPELFDISEDRMVVNPSE